MLKEDKRAKKEHMTENMRKERRETKNMTRFLKVYVGRGSD